MAFYTTMIRLLKIPFRPFFSPIMSLFILLFGYNAIFGEACKDGRRPLFFFADRSVANHSSPDFTNELFSQLQAPLKEISYCLTQLDAKALADTTVADEMVMFLTMDITLAPRPMGSATFHDSFAASDFDTIAEMEIALVRLKDWSPTERQQSLEHPLISLSYNTAELSTFQSVLIRKIVENLRTQYICHLRIQSIPEHTTIRSTSGLEGVTPLEWILPMGPLTITGKAEGYEPLRRKIDLQEPGMHTYVLQMRKNQFYNSKFIYPTILGGIATVASYLLEQHYYNEYSKLGKTDLDTRPDHFAQLFSTAQRYQSTTAACFVLTGASFALSFWF